MSRNGISTYILVQLLLSVISTNICSKSASGKHTQTCCSIYIETLSLALIVKCFLPPVIHEIKSVSQADTRRSRPHHPATAQPVRRALGAGEDWPPRLATAVGSPSMCGPHVLPLPEHTLFVGTGVRMNPALRHMLPVVTYNHPK